MDKKKVVNIDMKQYGMFIVLIAVFLIFALMTGGKNLSPANINNLIMQNSYVIILATGMLLCVLTGNVDLGVGSVVALCGSVVGVLIIDLHVNKAVAIIAAILVGLLCGMFAGFFIAVMGVPPFIVTLATMLMGRGATYTILKAQTKGPFDQDYNYIGAGFLPQISVGNFDLLCLIIAIAATVAIIFNEMRSIAAKKKYGFAQNPFYQIVIKNAVFIVIIWFVLIKLGQYSGFPFVLVIMGAIVGIYSFITSKTVAGRQIYALGGNRKAAQLSGIKTDRVFFWVYTNMGFLAGIAGVVLSARNGSATPKAGDQFEMDAIASCYLGGAAVAGGAGTIFGAVIGAFIMGILNNGMSLYGWSTDIQKIVKGAVLLGAVTADLMSKRKKS
ncbi:MAG: sugar ABC transporter permease [Lachnospiraceae bacterium]|nr:sugar ABC transporter permease [Lachnospiraceae bacterium]